MAQRRRKNRKWLIGVVILVLLVAGGVGVAVALNNANQDDGQDNSEEFAREEVEEKTDTEKRSEETEEEYSERMAEQKKVKQYEGEDPNKTEELSGAITYAGVNNGALMIAMNIDQFLGEGNCALSLVRGGSVIYSADAKILAEVSTSTCDGFNVPVSGLGDGVTEIIIKLSSGGKTGTIKGGVNI